MTSSTSDADRLAQYVDAWKSAVDDTVALLRSLDDEDWARPTDLAGWDVKAVAAHLAHLESELAGNEQQHVEVAQQRDGALHGVGPGVDVRTEAVGVTHGHTLVTPHHPAAAPRGPAASSPAGHDPPRRTPAA